MDFERFLDLVKALTREGVEYVLVGGVALNLHGIVRATEDVDLFIRPSEDNVDRLKRAPTPSSSICSPRWARRSGSRTWKARR